MRAVKRHREQHKVSFNGDTAEVGDSDEVQVLTEESRKGQEKDDTFLYVIQRAAEEVVDPRLIWAD